MVCVSLPRRTPCLRLPNPTATYHLSVVHYGWASTLSFLSVAIATPIISRFGDVFDKRAVLAVSMALVCCGELACIMATSLATFIVGEILLGSFVGVTTVAMLE